MAFLPVNGVDADVLVNTGASSTVVPHSMCLKHGWKIHECNQTIPQMMTKSACGNRRLAEPFWTRVVFRAGPFHYKYNAWMRSLPVEPFIMMSIDFLEFKKWIFDFQKRELYVRAHKSGLEDRCTT